eukprot:TRINITY_DN10906_c0_g2_i2.p1 TRINITY_DN10906_c0_g2~~TRINITY_DN10906_c0_g2_i2.p1  ORF type:complete len:139 (+),score=11.02 TRINITY_DN10906_c0_g2_i2:70-486(+)
MEGASSNINQPQKAINLDLPLKEFSFDASKLKERFVQAITEKIPEMSVPDTRVNIQLIWNGYPGSIKDNCRKLAEPFKQIPNLSDIMIQISSTNLSDEECEIISSVLKESQSISSLKMYLYSTPITCLLYTSPSPRDS